MWLLALALRTTLGTPSQHARENLCVSDKTIQVTNHKISACLLITEQFASTPMLYDVLACCMFQRLSLSLKRTLVCPIRVDLIPTPHEETETAVTALVRQE